ncbi:MULTISPECIES: rhodanese-like domain-containing protein [Cobetia]|uniref:Rhodanese-like domain-containing protein n=1 Tax=Cobetia crustatorum TaxID=553385 RepID=A0A558HNC4_9GAMM|nr:MULTISPECIES: rhodanese-like domain-containing protein [Cobetia]TVU70571.1 rhodanese-like domain-containing protein [Cobetia crustatorum]
MIRPVSELVASANAEVETLSASELHVALQEARSGGTPLTLVDIRDVRELEREGRVPEAIHAPRGMLEFWVDPASPYHRAEFAREGRYVLFCAGGLRSALATKALQDMGFGPVAHLDGGFAAWREAGGEVVSPFMQGN